MKKIILSLIAISTISTALMADGDIATEYSMTPYSSEEYKNYAEAKDSERIISIPYVYLGVSQYKAFEESDNAFVFGAGIEARFPSNIIAGFGIGGSYAKVYQSSFTDFTIDTKLGYRFTKNFDTYIIGAYKSTNIDPDRSIGNSDTFAYGFGAGLGAEFDITPSIAVSVEYTAFAMDPDDTYGNYDNNNLGLKFKYMFGQ